MGILKDIDGEVSVALDNVRAIRAWASVSFGRVTFIMALSGAILVGGYSVNVYNLLNEVTKANENRTREISALTKENGYKVALDAITACVESTKEKPTLNAWYCEQAIIQYKSVSIKWPQERVKDVIDKHAYVAMKNDVSHYLRTVELDRLTDSPPSKEEKDLQSLLSKTAVAFWVFIIAAVVIWFYVFF